MEAELLMLRQLWSARDDWRDRLARALAARAVTTHPAGRTVIRAGASQVALYLVLDGCARAMRDDGASARVEPGDLIDGGVLSDRPSGVTVVAVTQLRLLPIGIVAIEALAVEDPGLIVEMLAHQRRWWSRAEWFAGHSEEPSLS